MTSAALVLADSASLAPPVHCLCGDESAATAVICDDAVVILVAEGAGEASGRLADLFEDFARRGTPLGASQCFLTRRSPTGGSPVSWRRWSRHTHTASPFCTAEDPPPSS